MYVLKKHIHATSSENCIVAYALSLSITLKVSQQRHNVLCQKGATMWMVGWGGTWCHGVVRGGRWSLGGKVHTLLVVFVEDGMQFI